MNLREFPAEKGPRTQGDSEEPGPFVRAVQRVQPQPPKSAWHRCRSPGERGTSEHLENDGYAQIL